MCMCVCYLEGFNCVYLYYKVCTLVCVYAKSTECVATAEKKSFMLTRILVLLLTVVGEVLTVAGLGGGGGGVGVIGGGGSNTGGSGGGGGSSSSSSTSGGGGGVGNVGGWGKQSESRRLSSRVVNTKHGSLRGFIQTLPEKHLQPVEVFLGVPYAMPPMGALRFMPPVSPTPWRGIRPADTFGPVCPQRLPDITNETAALHRMPRGRLHYLKRLLTYLRNQSEDCLYLNIYAPAKVGRDLGPLPVMVYIHGESYEWNSGNPYDGTVLASYGDVVVVTINFRLGILGFLRAEDGIRGNYGLLDQVGALTWIAQNIEEFGGDRNNVTLVGQGYGAACVNFLMISPVARGYFHRAILQSGSALSSWALVKDPMKYSRQVTQAVNCPSGNDLAVCLRQRPVNDFTRLNIKAPDYLTAFGPTVDGIVISQEPQLAMQHYAEVFSKYDLLFGTTKVEVIKPFTAEDMQFGFEADRRDKILRTFLTNSYEYHLNEIFALLVNEYTDWTRPAQHPINTRDATIEILGDAVVVAPLVLTGNLHSSPKQNTFFYNFAYQSRGGDYPRRLGCFHGEELPYVFGSPMVDGLGHFHRNYTKAERVLSETVMAYWTNFAKTGDPNIQSKQQSLDSTKSKSRFTKTSWPQYDNGHEKYIALGMRSKVRTHYRAHKLSVWLRLIPVIHQEDKENTSPHHHMLYRSQNVTTFSGTIRKPGSRYPSAPSPPTHFPLYPNQSVRGGGSGYYNTSTTSTSGVGGRPTMVEAAPGSGPWITSQDPSLSENNVALAGGGGGILGAIPTAGEGAKNTSDRLKAEAIYHGSYSTALSVTIAVGCSLLILNVLIFAGVYYQRDKNRLEAKLQKKNYKLKTMNDDMLLCSQQQQQQGPGSGVVPPSGGGGGGGGTPQKQPLGVSILPRAPPPSPVGQSSRPREPPDFPSAAIVAQTLNTLKSPPKVPPKPTTALVSSNTEMNALTEVQPLLAQNAASGNNKTLNKSQKMQEIRV